MVGLEAMGARDRLDGAARRQLPARLQRPGIDLAKSVYVFRSHPERNRRVLFRTRFFGMVSAIVDSYQFVPIFLKSVLFLFSLCPMLLFILLH